MKEQLDGLERKVEDVLALCRTLTADNLDLRTRLSALEAEKRTLAEHMTEARRRIEGLMAGLPEE